MKIFLDDIREPPDDSWFVCRTYRECEKYILYYHETIEEISFDHDLGEDKTGYDVAKLFEHHCFHKHFPCPKWIIHSANPVGRANIEMAMRKAEYWSETGKK